MLEETHRGWEYRMDAAQDCLTLSLLCLMAPCRKPGRQHCTTLYGQLTKPRCTWWTSWCRTGTCFKICFTPKSWNGLSQIYVSASARHVTQTDVQTPVKRSGGLEEKNVACVTFVETWCVKIDVSVCCESSSSCWKGRGKLSSQLSSHSHKAKRNGSSTFLLCLNLFLSFQLFTHQCSNRTKPPQCSSH